MKHQIVLFVLLILFLIVPLADGFAHGGGTDSQGGHYDRSTGQYHYHHGYSAHQHPNGVCPYDYKDKTGQNSGTSGGSGSYSYYTTAPRPTTAPRTQKPKTNGIGGTVALIASGGAVAVAAGVVSHNAKKRKEAERARLAKEAAERERKISFYRKNDLRTLSGMPAQYYVNEQNVPMEKDKPKGYMYGKTLDIYLSNSSSSYVYHSRDCKYSRELVNAISASRMYYLPSRRPCSLCSPPPLPDTDWYTKYLSHAHECEKLGIEPLREPSSVRSYTPTVYVSYRDDVGQ